jgi:3-hydroxyisobutyrate dehydrogenase-like beta-hydroxyacid dehydrogenase
MNVGVIGLGIMGSAIARNLVAAGHRVIGFDIDPAALARLSAAGGDSAQSVAQVAASAPILLTSLPSEQALTDTVSAIEASEIADGAGLVLAELSTLPLATKTGVFRRLAALGVEMLDCPLSGTGAQAVTRDLTVYASGDQVAYVRCAEAFQGFAARSVYLGEFGNGSKMKFVANLLVAINNVASAEAMALAVRAGLDPELTAQVIAQGAGTSRIFELRAPLMARRSYEPATMKLDIWKKDMAIIGEFAAGLGARTPLFQATESVYRAALAQGPQQDTAAVFEVLRG